MMKKYFFLILTLCSCSNLPKNENRSDVSSYQIPSWHLSPQENCSMKKLCGSGEGNSFDEADQKAFKSVAEYFGVKIKSHYSSQKNFDDTKKISAEFSSDRFIEESVDVALKKVQISERKKMSDKYYSLAELDLRAWSLELSLEIEKLDEKMLSYYQLFQKKYLVQINKLLSQRNEKTALLMAVDRQAVTSSPISEDQLQKLKAKGKDVFLSEISPDFQNDIPQMIKQKLNSILAEYQIKLSENAPNLLQVTFNHHHLPMKVKGFEKYEFKLSVQKKNKDKKLDGGFFLQWIAVGKNVDDAMISLSEKISSDIDENFYLLNL